MVGEDYGAVDHLQGAWHSSALVQCLHDVLPEPGQRPAPELPIDARPLAELPGKIAPRRPGSGNPENPIKNEAVVGGFTPVRGADGEDEALKERLFLVRHKVSCQAGLHRRCQLESCSKPDVNPFCQHDLCANVGHQ